MLSKIGRYEMWAQPFHCDFLHLLQPGHLGNDILNAADYHSTDRGFGMRYLNTVNKTWVLSRLCIEMEKMPIQYQKFVIETWVEGAMRYFTQRDFRIADSETDETLGYGRSVWALIDLTSRQPTDILSIRDGEITSWVEKDKACPIAKPGRVKVSADAPHALTIATRYSDVDVNGHINSVRYIEHILDLFTLSHFEKYHLRRLDIAYVAESHYGDTLRLYRQDEAGETLVRITKVAADPDAEEQEVLRCSLVWQPRQE